LIVIACLLLLLLVAEERSKLLQMENNVGAATADPARQPVQPRGVARRQALLDAAVRLLAREGARAVTHRAVAAEAGTTHGAPRYWFATRDELLDEALRQLAERQVAAAEELLRQTSPTDPRERAARLAAFVTGTIAADRDATIARYELFLEAARRPTLRPALEAWGDAYARLFAAEVTAHASDPLAEAELLLNLLNGLLLREAAAPREDFERGVLLPAIERFLAL
jgi:DNA-binding transcriptional regulator YbjK